MAITKKTILDKVEFVGDLRKMKVNLVDVFEENGQEVGRQPYKIRPNWPGDNIQSQLQDYKVEQADMDEILRLKNVSHTQGKIDEKKQRFSK